jgi:hypothetical protein
MYFRTRLRGRANIEPRGMINTSFVEANKALLLIKTRNCHKCRILPTRVCQKTCFLVNNFAHIENAVVCRFLFKRFIELFVLHQQDELKFGFEVFTTSFQGNTFFLPQISALYSARSIYLHSFMLITFIVLKLCPGQSSR